jgi:hypothetical protein
MEPGASAHDLHGGSVRRTVRGGLEMNPLLLMSGGALGLSHELLGAGGSIRAVPALIVLGDLSPR